MWLVALFLELILLLILIIICLVVYRQYQLKAYFKKRNIPFLHTDLPRLFLLLSGRLSIPEIEKNVYSKCKSLQTPLTGFAEAFVSKGVMITDLTLARNIFVKDFDHFVNRRKFTAPKGDELFKKAFMVKESEEWKGMRAKISPTFTTGKIRRMFQIFLRTSERMNKYLKSLSGPTGVEYDMSNLFSKVSMDVIASCAFGVNSKSFEMPPGKLSEFEEMAGAVQFKFGLTFLLKLVVITTVPKLADLLGMEIINPIPQNYFKQVINSVMKHRRKTGERQEDFLQMIMDVQQGLLKEEEESKEVLEVLTGSTEGDVKNNESFTKAGKNLKLEDIEIVANCAMFLTAGFDTIHSLMVWAAYALAINQDVQGRLREEIKKEVEAKGELTYDGVHGMVYLDKFINETLRYFPPGMRTERVCTKDYKIPGTEMEIEKGTLVVLPIIAVHRDERYFENPEKFDVERFSSERKGDINTYAFRPFGHGPRNCIGMRFALTEAKLVIASLVKDFIIEPSSRTEVPPTFSMSVSLKPKNGMWLNVKPIK